LNSCFDVELVESQLDDLTEDIMKMDINKENNEEPPSMGSTPDTIRTCLLLGMLFLEVELDTKLVVLLVYYMLLLRVNMLALWMIAVMKRINHSFNAKKAG
jgi:hypothetical protein